MPNMRYFRSAPERFHLTLVAAGQPVAHGW
jgi:hypothetical protein